LNSVESAHKLVFYSSSIFVGKLADKGFCRLKTGMCKGMYSFEFC